MLDTKFKSFKAHNLVFCKNLGFLEQLYFYAGFKESQKLDI